MGNACSSGNEETFVDTSVAGRLAEMDKDSIQDDGSINALDIERVQLTWNRAAALGAPVVGKKVFKKIFELAPPALSMFHFKDDPNLYDHGSRLETHAVKVVTTLDTAVKGLSDLNALVPVLKTLGLQHVSFGVIEPHYDVVLEALGAVLGPALSHMGLWTPAVQKSWGKVLQTVKAVMLAGAKEGEAAKGDAITVDLDSPAVDLAAPVDARDIALVTQTWKKVSKLGFKAVGKVVFKNIFTIAPEALQLFKFKDDAGPNLYNDGGRLEAHAEKVIEAVDAAVGLLHTETAKMDELLALLKSLGMRHGALGVVAAHYDVVGQAVLEALSAVLEHQYTDAVKNAWLKIYTVIKTTMVGAADEAAKVSAKSVAKRKVPAKKAAAGAAAPAAAS